MWPKDSDLAGAAGTGFHKTCSLGTLLRVFDAKNPHILN